MRPDRAWVRLTSGRRLKNDRSQDAQHPTEPCHGRSVPPLLAVIGHSSPGPSPGRSPVPREAPAADERRAH
jgi:hypothetical protein